RIIYDKWEDGELVKRVNELSYFKHWTDQVDIEEMLAFGKHGYCKYVANKFGFYDNENNRFNYIIEEEAKAKDDLENYLNSTVGERLLKKGQQDLINKINLRDAKNRLQKGLKTINAYLQENNMAFMVIS